MPDFDEIEEVPVPPLRAGQRVDQRAINRVFAEMAENADRDRWNLAQFGLERPPVPEQPEQEETGMKELDIDAIPEGPKRVVQPFYLVYDTLDEVRMKFLGTVITIKSQSFYVQDIRNSLGRRNVYNFRLVDGYGNYWNLRSDRIKDFRSHAPGYIVYRGSVAFMKRLPARANQVGIHRNNTHLISPKSGAGLQWSEANLPLALKTRPPLVYSPTLRTLLIEGHTEEFRLSDNIAVFAKTNKKQDIVAEYRGRRLGKLEENTVILDDEDDLLQPQVTEAARAVELNVKVP